MVLFGLVAAGVEMPAQRDTRATLLVVARCPFPAGFHHALAEVPPIIHRSRRCRRDVEPRAKLVDAALSRPPSGERVEGFQRRCSSDRRCPLAHHVDYHEFLKWQTEIATIALGVIVALLLP